jgi:hypothetical protein
MRIATTALALAGLAAGAQADTLWDQSSLNWDTGFYNTISGAPPFGVTAYTVADVTILGGGWTIDSVTMYFTCFDFNWNSTTSGRLYIQSKSGGAPTVLPGGPLISMSVEILSDPSVQQAYYAVTASGLDRTLGPGEYWIGITPAAPGGFFGPERGLGAAAVHGADSFTYAVGGNGWETVSCDAAILINGTAVPAPAGLAALTVGGALSLRRRRR